MSSVIKPELLSPAGNMESVRAAVNNGCDAVYIGGKNFSARAYAGNFDIDEIEQVCDYCHLRNVKVYAAVNTIYKNEELKSLLSYVSSLSRIGVDALIMQDLGAAKAVRERFDIPINASTQLTANSLNEVQALMDFGFSRVILSRELSLDEIEYIAQNCSGEIETFIHGALCVCYSGQCLMSSMLGGRSGNRGKCAQTCRLPYTLINGYNKIKEGYLLSTKDIETVTILPQLIKSGISSFKIEGRMKSPEYVAGVTGIYRKYIDKCFDNIENYEVDKEDFKKLLQLFNRGGFSEGYYNTHSGSSMMSVERPKSWGLKVGLVDKYNPKNGWVSIRTREALHPGDGIEIWTSKEPHAGSNINKASKAGEVISLQIKGDISKNDVVYRTRDKVLEDELKKTFEKDTRTKEIYAEGIFVDGKPSSLKLYDEAGNSVFVKGDIVSRAENQPVSRDKIIQQIKKTGGTSFKISDIKLEMSDNVYIGISSLNKLRREAVEALEEKIINSYKRKNNAFSGFKPKHNDFSEEKKINVYVRNMSQFEAAVTHKGINIIYFELSGGLGENTSYCLSRCHENGIKLYVGIPRIYREYTRKIYNDDLEKVVKNGIDGFLVRSYGQFVKFKKFGKEIAVDYSTNIYNMADADFWREQKAESLCLSPELNIKEINSFADKNTELLIYGHIPLMTTNQCPIGAYDGEKENGMFCKKRFSKDSYFFKDRKGEDFPIITDCRQCVCQILNGKPLFLLKFFDQILETPSESLRLMFTTETAAETDNIIKAHFDMLKNPDKPSAAVKRLIAHMADKGSTRGHYFRGIE